MKYRLLKSFSEIFQNVLFHFRAPGTPIVLYPISFLNFAKIICTNMSNMSIYSANFRYIACKLLKLEALENRKKITGAFLDA